MSPIDNVAFKEAMSRLPSGVTIVSTSDDQNRRWGFTASSFTSLSMDPPLILVCLSNYAESYEAFIKSQRFAINVLSHEQKQIAMDFARKNTDKFSGSSFVHDEEGCPYLPEAVASIICKARNPHVEGDHTILIGEVLAIHLGATKPLIYFQREFWHFEPTTVLS
ncbi:flavin reductase family protein [Bordetella sp. 15P40C-2]|uniref:flavin reductase family protein n=1 Tax=Bordetella sp. 15P40C-2 TaxID=2572246 RepID=UPI0013654872|nr:flavin reductase family protein [Bordetella sp. 15P40C-2]